jgi:Flp pilus assembly protein TadG
MFQPRLKPYRLLPVLGTQGTAAVEFAIIMTFFLVVFVGSFEILTLLRTSQKLNIVSATVAQAIAYQSPDGSAMPSTTPQDVCYGAVKGLQPFSANGLTIDIASVTTTTVGSAVNYWEQDFSGSSCTPVTPAVIGSTSACNLATNNGAGGMLPKTNGAIGDNAIIVRATLTYPGLVGLWLKTSPTLTQQVLTRWAYASTSNSLTVTGVTPQPISCSG